MLPKFPFKVINGAIIMDEATKQRRSDYMRTLKDGDYEDVIRPEIKWDTAQMRKYFHLIMKFIRIECQKQGHVTTESQLKLDFKEMFGPKESKKTLLGVKDVPISTSLYDVEIYRQIITDVKAWCKDKMHFDIPDKEDLDLGSKK